jgi:hypothetical protein
VNRLAQRSRGLLVPIVRTPYQMSCRARPGDPQDLGETARQARHVAGDMTGGHDHIDPHGRIFGVDNGTPIRNPGEVGCVPVLAAGTATPWSSSTQVVRASHPSCRGPCDPPRRRRPARRAVLPTSAGAVQTDAPPVVWG